MVSNSPIWPIYLPCQRSRHQEIKSRSINWRAVPCGMRNTMARCIPTILSSQASQHVSAPPCTQWGSVRLCSPRVSTLNEPAQRRASHGSVRGNVQALFGEERLLFLQGPQLACARRTDQNTARGMAVQRYNTTKKTHTPGRGNTGTAVLSR